ncbi:MAG: hypothetical protein KA444_02250 [Bacteroidia bacterium]|nr:hypothetical protein [Bacteroidia bacterium]
MKTQSNRSGYKTDLIMVGLVFILTLLLLFSTSCKHEPQILPKADITTEPTGNGNGNGSGNQTSTCDPDSVYFQKVILPLIVSNCATSGCHDAVTHEEGIVLDSYQNIMNHGDIRIGNPGTSELYEVITDNDPDKRMPPPPANPMSQADIDLIATWIRQGAQNNTCTDNSCDSSMVTFSGTIAPMLQSKCVGCHNNSTQGGQVNLSGFANVNTSVQNGKLLGSIEHASGFAPMPKATPKLSPCEIAVVRTWIREGAINN